MNPKYIPRFFILFFLITMLFGSTANATTLNYSFSVDTVIGSNPYGLSVTDTVTGSVTLDYAQGESDGTYTTHTSIDDPNVPGDTSDSAFLMSLVLGNTTYNEYDDDWWASWPAVTILDSSGLISGIEFYVTNDTSTVEITNETGELTLTAASLDSSWSITATSPVPEPATLTLFGLSLLGLAGLHRKRSLK